MSDTHNNSGSNAQALSQMNGTNVLPNGNAHMDDNRTQGMMASGGAGDARGSAIDMNGDEREGNGDDEMDEDEEREPRPPVRHAPSISSGVRPRGILKNARQGSIEETQRPTVAGEHLTWDEANIQLTEIQRDSQMKIDEPKTPFVRNDAMELEDVPDLELGSGSSSRSPSRRRSCSTDPALVAANTAANAGPARPVGFPHLGQMSGSSGTSVGDSNDPFSPTDAEERPAVQTRQRTPSQAGSGPSSRSASFNLPDEKSGRMRGAIGSDATGEEVEEDDDASLDPETREHRREFKHKMKSHYSNEADAMKLAQALIAQDPEEEDEE